MRPVSFLQSGQSAKSDLYKPVFYEAAFGGLNLSGPKSQSHRGSIAAARSE